jgi:signal transduction histidine kinase
MDRFQRRRLIGRERERARERELEQAREIERAYTQLKATQAQLIQQEQMASLGQLTAGIAHEIKNPLNFVNNFSEIVVELCDELGDLLSPHLDATLQGEADDFRMILADLRQNAGVIVQHGKRADGIVHAMMQHASGSTGRREATDVNALVSEHIDLAYHGKRAQVQGLTVEIKRDLDGQVGTVEIVPQEIGRVLLNLLGNAVDAVHEHALSINGSYMPTVTVQTRRVEEGVEIRVSDNGPGIPEAILEKIFEPFFTTKPAGSGTGLGLSMSYDIVTQGHSGTLTVESPEGEGATFVVTLPTDASR